MGIGVNYIGGGGSRSFDLDGAPTKGSVAEALLGAASLQAPKFIGGGDFAPLLEALAPTPKMEKIESMADDADKGKVKVSVGDTPEVLERKLAPEGSVMAQGNRIMLKGDESVGGGRRMYGVNGGRRGFFNLSEYDPGGGGKVLSGEGDAENGTEANLDGRAGATMKIGRIYIYIDNTEKEYDQLVAKEFYRLAKLTPNGRIVYVSGETGSEIFRMALGGGNGKYSVRPFWEESHDDPERPHLVSLAFGSDANLDTWNDDKRRFDCNYDENDELLDDPPVKIVDTDRCHYAQEE
jgi:hypothetical protein